MTQEKQSKEKDEILGAMRAYHAAMIEARTTDLNKLLDIDYSLVHITGYVQPKNEWFGVLQSGQFDYHKIDVDEKTLSVSLSGSSALLKGRGIFNATINGMKNPWRLQFEIRFEKSNENWRIMHARYTSF